LGEEHIGTQSDHILA